MTDQADRLAHALADRYRIEGELGAGGMATVYLAEDVKHHRKVAVKVLRPELAAVLGADRFVQEIETTANLQHPHILPLFDSGEANGFLYYVMPFIDGETLRDKLNRETQLGIEEAVKIVTEVADALEYAHGNNVIHRDIKPENILLHNGRPMVADFGIALAVSAAAGGRMTETGLSLGTPHYMSPEQATAEKDLTNRSDIYSLGSVLYEMLTGEPPHTGGSAQAIIMKIVTEPADPVTKIRKSVPPHVAAATAKSLEKLAADRFESAARFAEALLNPAYTLPSTPTAMTGASTRGSGNILLAIVSGLAVLFAGAALWERFRPSPAPAVARYGLAFPPGQELLDDNQAAFALAPDGSWIVYDGPAESGRQLWVKRGGNYEATPLPGTEHSRGSAPAVSPDGEWIVFTADRQLRKIPRGGGSPITVADSVYPFAHGIAWLDDGTIVYSDPNARLRRVSEGGDDAEIVFTPPERGLRARLPTPLPDARGVLFGLCRSNRCTEPSAWVLDLRSGVARQLRSDVSQAWYTETGHLVYVRPDGGVFAAPFDLKSLDIVGSEVPVLQGVKGDLNGTIPDFALSRSGSVLMLAGESATGVGVPSAAVWVSRDGVAVPVDPSWTFRTGGNRGVALSDDGSRLAFMTRGDAGDDIWIKELDQGPTPRLTVNSAQEFRPRWMPDGRSVSFISNRGVAPDSSRGQNYDVYRRLADQTQPAELVLDLEVGIFEAIWSRDGQWLVVRVRTGTTGNADVWAFRPGIDGTPTTLLTSEFYETAVALSPDGQWLAYQSNESGQNEIYVRAFPDMTAKQQISIGGGTFPLWANSGRELFYVDSDVRMVAAQITLSTVVEVEERRALFPVDDYHLIPNHTNFDISPDDQRFLMTRTVSVDDGSPAALILIENWFEELKEMVGN